MSIILNEEKKVALSQSFTFDELHIIGGENGKLEAIVSFVVKNEKGERLAVERLHYSSEDFNTFWEEFNTGKYLYDRLVEDKELSIEVPEEVEENFVNESGKVKEDIININK